MTFANAWVLHLFWLLPVVGLALAAHHRQRGRALTRFAEPVLLGRLTGTVLPGRRALKVAFILSALGLMIFALSGPRWGSRYQEVAQKGVDIVILADVSPSMMVEDIKPNRLEQARREIHDFLQVVQGDRVGLVAFSGAAYLQCPLTLDYAALEMFLQALVPELIPTAGTDLGAAIETGLAAFDPKAETDKVMLLITDGEDNEGRGQEAARRAGEKGVKIFVFGIGETAGGPIPIGDQGGFKKDDAGTLVLSRVDEEGLRKIADDTGGRYVRSVAGDFDLDLLYFDGIKTRTTAQTLKSGKIRIEEERYFLFLVPAFIFLLLEGFLAERKPFRPTVLVVPLLLGLALAPVCARATEDPDRLFGQGRWAEAEKAYAALDMDHPKDLRYRYNRGCAAFQNGDYQGAIAAFSSTIVRGGDESLRFKATFNLGNAVFQKGDFAAAADLYRNALRLDPANQDARHNLELSLRKLAQQKRDQKKGEERKDSPGEQDDNQAGSDKNQNSRNQKPGDQKSEQGRESSKADTSPKEKEPAQESEPSDGGDKIPDLSGELQPLQELPKSNQQENQDGPAASSMDRQKAEALLNNVSEDRSHLRQGGAGQRRAVGSGRDW